MISRTRIISQFCACAVFRSVRCYSHSGSTLTITLVTITINLKYPSCLGVKLEETEKIYCTERVQCKYSASLAPVHFFSEQQKMAAQEIVIQLPSFLTWQVWFETDTVPKKNYFCILRALRHLLFTKLLIKQLPELLSTISASLLLSKQWFPPPKKTHNTKQTNNTNKTERENKTG